MLSKELILEELKKVKYPGFSRDIVSFGIVKDITIKGDHVDLQLNITTSDPSVVEKIENDSQEILKAIPFLNSLNIKADVTAPIQAAMEAGGVKKQSIPGVKNIIAVGSGKGGVGKSTVASNLAVALHVLGYKVGLCDCDLYGPSIGLMFGKDEHPMMSGEDRIEPIDCQGMKLMSMSFLLEGDEAPVIMRGPMVTRYTQQFLRNTDWGDLDYLILDLPPGTGDIQLTIVQTIALSGAVIVTTPQEVALIDARKAVSMFHKVSVPILGLIENMSYFLSPSDNKRYYIFGEGGGKREAEKMNIPLLGEIPIDIATREAGDKGLPIVFEEPESETGKIFIQVAQNVSEVVKAQQEVNA
jgi:ATP-binding protein involved in chromosome partitioning